MWSFGVAMVSPSFEESWASRDELQTTRSKLLERGRAGTCLGLKQTLGPNAADGSIEVFAIHAALRSNVENLSNFSSQRI